VDQEEPLDDNEASTFRERCCMCDRIRNVPTFLSTLFSDDNPVEQQQPRRESRKRKQTEAGAAFTSQELSKKKRRQRKPRQQSEITTSTSATTTTTTTSSATTASTSTTMSTTTTSTNRRRWKHQHRRPMLIWLHKHCSCARAARRLSARSYRLHTTSRRRKKKQETRRRTAVDRRTSTTTGAATTTTPTRRRTKTNLHANKHKTFVHVQQSDNYERNDTEWRVTACACSDLMTDEEIQAACRANFSGEKNVESPLDRVAAFASSTRATQRSSWTRT
jgi:hypothetical protein